MNALHWSKLAVYCSIYNNSASHQWNYAAFFKLHHIFYLAVTRISAVGTCLNVSFGYVAQMIRQGG